MTEGDSVCRYMCDGIICNVTGPSYGLLWCWRWTYGFWVVIEQIFTSSELCRSPYPLQEPCVTMLCTSLCSDRRYSPAICIQRRNNSLSACHQGFVRPKIKRQPILYRYKLLRFKILVECSNVKGSRSLTADVISFISVYFCYSVILPWPRVQNTISQRRWNCLLG